MRKFFIAGLFSILSFISIAQMPKLVFPIGQTERIDSIQLTYNAKKIYTYSNVDNTFKVWDIYSGKLLIDLNTRHFSISSNQKKISIALNDSTVRIWNIANDNTIDLKLLRSGIIGSKFSPDNKLLLTFSVDDICIWDVSTGIIKNKLKDNNLNYYLKNSNKLSPEFSSNSKDILFLTYENTLNIWNIATNNFSKVEVDKGFDISSVKLSPDSSKIVVISSIPHENYSFIKIWNYHTSKFISQLISNDNFRYAEFSPDGKKLVTISNKIDSDKNRIKVWGVNSGQQLYTLSFKKSLNDSKNGQFTSFDTEDVDRCQSVQFSPDGKRLLVLYEDSKAKVWDTDNGRLVSEFSDILVHRKDNIHYIYSAEFSKDGTKILTISENYPLVSEIWDKNPRFTEIWDSSTGKLITHLRDSSNHLEQSKFSFNGKLVITLNSNNTARVWEIERQSKMIDYNFNGHTKINPEVQFSPDNKSILTVADNKLYLWELNTGSLLRSFSGHKSLIKSARFSRDGKSIVSASADSTAKIWDSTTGLVKLNLVGHKNTVNYAEFSTDQKFVLTASDDGTSIVWNANNGIALGECKLVGSDDVGNTFNILSAHFSNDAKRIITRPNDGTVNLWEWNGSSGKFIADLKFFISNMMTVAVFSPDSKKIFAASNGGIAAFWDTSTGKKLNEFKISPNVIISAQFNPDNNKILIVNDNQDPQIISSNNIPIEPINLKGHDSYVIYAEYSDDGTKVLTVSDDKTSKVWNSNTGALITSLNGHTNQVYLAHFSPDQKMILSTSYDNTIKIWNANNGKLILTFFVVDTANYFSQIPNGFYKTSPEAAKLLHYVTKDLKIITFEQLDIKYNRPDKVLQAIGNTDTTLIRSYKRAYEKRIEKLGIDTTSFTDDYNVPEADFANREPKIENGNVVLRIKGEDKKSKLAQFNVWVNEVPVYGLRGVSIHHLNNYKLDTTITIQLSEGENKIEMSVRNINGIESYRMPLTIKYNSETKPKEKVYFVGIGIDKFKDNSRNLMYSVKDIRVLTAEVQKKYGNNLIIVDTLINTKVTVENVKALKKKLLRTTVNDKVIVAYSGHGLLNAKNDYYLSTYAVDFKKPEGNGLSYDDLESIIDSIPARKKLLLLDACHSGEVDRGTPPKAIKINNDSSTTAMNNYIKKGGGEAEENPLKNRIGLKNSFELMQSLFVNVGKNTGATIFTAAAGKQAAYESNKLGHGVFTYFIIDAFRNKPTLTVSKLKEIVAQNVENESKKSQIPTSRSETIAVDWVLW